MLILGIVATILILIICIASIVHFRDKYKKAIAKGKEAEEKLREAANAARVAAGQRPRPGSGVDRSERGFPPDPPPNRTATGQALTQPRPTPRARPGSSADPFADMSRLFEGMGERMTEAFNNISQSFVSVTEQATQLVDISTAIARDAQTLLELRVTQEHIVVNQSRTWNLHHLAMVNRFNTRDLRRLTASNSRADHPNWGSLVREFMRMIQSGELVFRDNQIDGASMGSHVVGQQVGASGQPGRQATVNSQAQPTPEASKESEPEKKLPPTRFEREDVI